MSDNGGQTIIALWPRASEGPTGWRGLFIREHFDEAGHDAVAVFAREGEGKLAEEQAVVGAYVVALPLDFVGENFFALAELVESGREELGFRAFELSDFFQNFENGGF